jgi:hypothetical protein
MQLAVYTPPVRSWPCANVPLLCKTALLPDQKWQSKCQCHLAFHVFVALPSALVLIVSKTSAQWAERERVNGQKKRRTTVIEPPYVRRLVFVSVFIECVENARLGFFIINIILSSGERDRNGVICEARNSSNRCLEVLTTIVGRT